MSKIEKKLPTLTETNPILLWLYKHGIEDLDWGKKDSHFKQIAIASIIHELAKGITDIKIREQIQTGAANSLVNVSGKMKSGK
ncbi:MAG: hypothetical protein IPH77_08510 [Ignavibacteria bacterium]|nr:hypothetical protein [Ignavibacteria bacterium]